MASLERYKERQRRVSPFATEQQIEREARQARRWARQSNAKFVGIALAVITFVVLSVVHENTPRYTPDEAAAEACESWRFYPEAKTYQEGDVRDRMLRLSRQAADGNDRWANLATAIEQDRPAFTPGAPPGELDEYLGPTSPTGTARRAALRQTIEQECVRAAEAAGAT